MSYITQRNNSLGAIQVTARTKSTVHVIAQPDPSLSSDATHLSKILGASKCSDRIPHRRPQSLGIQALIGETVKRYFDSTQMLWLRCFIRGLFDTSWWHFEFKLTPSISRILSCQQFAHASSGLRIAVRTWLLWLLACADAWAYYLHRIMWKEIRKSLLLGAWKIEGRATKNGNFQSSTCFWQKICGWSSKPNNIWQITFLSIIVRQLCNMYKWTSTYRTSRLQ